jgi:membrane-bound serine protease (ClpP class)
MSKARALGVVLLGSLLALGAALVGITQAQSQDGDPTVLSLTLNGVVDPFVANYIANGIDKAETDGDAAVLLTLDTPGGLDSSMRKITQAILNAKVQVICYTAPQGARAASAGTFIMLACPINAMAPGTNIGAAHPVGVSGAIESSKVTNDAAAYIRSLAERWNRNPNWAEQAVRRSVSISAEEALRMHVVDLVSPTPAALFRDVAASCSGGGVVTGDRCPAQSLAGARIEERGMGIGGAFLHGLIDPNLAFLFFYLGLALLVIEILHPGVSVPGILGAVLLITAFVDFGFLPVQLAGVVLLVLSAVFFLLELKHPGIGLPTVGGVITLIFGGLLLFNSSVPNARVSPWLLAAVAVALVLFFGFVVRAVMKARHLPRAAGLEGMVGEMGVAIDDLNPTGRVRARRENWSAESVGPPIAKGTPVRVRQVRGLRLVVEEVAGAEVRGVAPGDEALPPTSRREGELAGDASAGRGEASSSAAVGPEAASSSAAVGPEGGVT